MNKCWLDDNGNLPITINYGTEKPACFSNFEILYSYEYTEMAKIELFSSSAGQPLQRMIRKLSARRNKRSEIW